jgi:hypothetical protein
MQYAFVQALLSLVSKSWCDGCDAVVYTVKVKSIVAYIGGNENIVGIFVRW